MEVIASTVIPRHAVVLDGSGLSTMQAAALAAQAPCTLISAPTSSGKTFVYQTAMLRGERILFIVPTRRLAQNVVRDMRAKLLAEGVAVRQVEQRVLCFTSDETARLRAAGMTGITNWRLGLLPGSSFSDDGGIVVATPEAVSWLLLHPTIAQGLGDVGPATFMTAFDRIVVDEVHLIQARGFGLMAVLARLAQDGPWVGEGGRVRAKVSALSATLIDIVPVMRRLGIEMRQEDTIREVLRPDGDRALHGDVTVEFVAADGLAEVAAARIGLLRALRDGETAAVVYDALRDLQAEKSKMRQVADEMGLDGSDTGFFIDNSLDAQFNTDFSGRHKDFSFRKLLVSTSTIEVGVTLPGLVLLLMEPGFSPLSFMQRLGRVARGDRPGRVVVRVSSEMLERRPWLRCLVKFAATSNGRINIEELVAFVAKLGRNTERFALPEVDFADPDSDAAFEGEKAADLYGTLSSRAIFCAGVYWHLLETALRNSQGSNHVRQANGVLACAPNSLGTIRSWMGQVSGTRIDGAKGWLRAFLAEATNLRDFTPTVRIIDRNGRIQDVSASWVAKQTKLYLGCVVIGEEDGRAIIRVDTIDWEALIREKGDVGRYSRLALLPCSGETVAVYRSPIETFQQALTRQCALLPGRHRRGVMAAGKLVACTGIVPYVESEADERANSVVL